MWQYYYSNNRTQTIHCGWTNKQMYMHYSYIITILRSVGKFIYILIHHIKLICIGCPFIISSNSSSSLLHYHHHCWQEPVSTSVSSPVPPVRPMPYLHHTRCSSPIVLRDSSIHPIVLRDSSIRIA